MLTAIEHRYELAIVVQSPRCLISHLVCPVFPYQRKNDKNGCGWGEVHLPR